MRLAITALFIGSVLVPTSSAKDNSKLFHATLNSDPAKGINFYSIQKEAVLGSQIAEEIEDQSDMLTDPMVTEYVSRLGQNLARYSGTDVRLHVKVIRFSETNAFSVPGGFVFVNTGLILNAENEAELAAIMAHEIAHVVARHGTKQATRGTIVNYATFPLVLMGGWARRDIRVAAGLAASRAMEEEADHLGLEYLYKAGYDPRAFVDFFTRIESLEQKRPVAISKLSSTHPMTHSRITRAQQVIEREMKPQAEYVVDTSEFHQVRQHVAAVHAISLTH
jgi:predicted Zn-dependent protease